MEDLPRTFLITDGRADLERLRGLFRAALDGGIRGVQVREPGLTARALGELCAEWKPAFDAASAMLLVNDRVDIAAAGFVHGVHLGHRSLPPDTVRAMLPEASVVA